MEWRNGSLDFLFLDENKLRMAKHKFTISSTDSDQNKPNCKLEDTMNTQVGVSVLALCRAVNRRLLFSVDPLCDKVSAFKSQVLICRSYISGLHLHGPAVCYESR